MQYLIIFMFLDLPEMISQCFLQSTITTSTTENISNNKVKKWHRHEKEKENIHLYVSLKRDFKPFTKQAMLKRC